MPTFAPLCMNTWPRRSSTGCVGDVAVLYGGGNHELGSLESEEGLCDSMDRLIDKHLVCPLLCHGKSISLLRGYGWHENLAEGQLPIFAIEGSGGLMIHSWNHLRPLGARFQEMDFIQANAGIVEEVR